MRELLEPVELVRVEVVAQAGGVRLKERGKRGTALQGFSRHRLLACRFTSRLLAPLAYSVVERLGVGVVGELGVVGEGLLELVQQALAAHERCFHGRADQ
ncbi:hypothetical protein GCM10027072_76900 [Streptomyces bullii]